MKVQFSVAEDQLEDWIKDVKEWAESKSSYMLLHVPTGLESNIGFTVFLCLSLLFSLMVAFNFRL